MARIKHTAHKKSVARKSSILKEVAAGTPLSRSLSLHVWILLDLCARVEDFDYFVSETLIFVILSRYWRNLGGFACKTTGILFLALHFLLVIFLLPKRSFASFFLFS